MICLCGMFKSYTVITGNKGQYEQNVWLLLLMLRRFNLGHYSKFKIPTRYMTHTPQTMQLKWFRIHENDRNVVSELVYFDWDSRKKVQNHDNLNSYWQIFSLFMSPMLNPENFFFTLSLHGYKKATFHDNVLRLVTK